MSAPLELHTLATSGEPPTPDDAEMYFFSWERSVVSPDGAEKIYGTTIYGAKNANGVLFLVLVHSTSSVDPVDGDRKLENYNKEVISEHDYDQLHPTLHQTHELVMGHRFENPDGISPNWEMMRAHGPEMIDRLFDETESSIAAVRALVYGVHESEEED